MSTLPAFALIGDLAARITGGIDDSDLERAQAALDDASTLIRSEAGRTWTTTNDDDEIVLDLPTGDDAWKADILLRVCCSAARRSLENPDGVSQESLGAYSVSVANASSDVYLTSGELRDIRRAAGKSGLSTITTTRSAISSAGVSGGLETTRCGDDGTEYLPVDPAGQDIPFTGPEGY